MIKINIRHFRCRARHGIFPEEKILGGEFEVNLDVSFEEKGKIHSIEQSISYTHLQEIIKTYMSSPQPLLETVCQQISDQIKADHPFVSEINISLCKLAPPIINFQGEVGVTYLKKFDL
jgi:7,8-dihydroneopterin aldolase/epimerase/oxygenase